MTGEAVSARDSDDPGGAFGHAEAKAAMEGGDLALGTPATRRTARGDAATVAAEHPRAVQLWTAAPGGARLPTSRTARAPLRAVATESTTRRSDCATWVPGRWRSPASIGLGLGVGDRPRRRHRPRPRPRSEPASADRGGDSDGPSAPFRHRETPTEPRAGWSCATWRGIRPIRETHHARGGRDRHRRAPASCAVVDSRARRGAPAHKPHSASPVASGGDRVDDEAI